MHAAMAVRRALISVAKSHKLGRRLGGVAVHLARVKMHDVPPVIKDLGDGTLGAGRMRHARTRLERVVKRSREARALLRHEQQQLAVRQQLLLDYSKF